MSDFDPFEYLPDVQAGDAIQRHGDGRGELPPAAVHAHASRGLTGAPQAMPFAAQIADSFGPAHNVRGIEAHVGGAATEAAHAIGATAYATGNRVAFAAPPDLHTAAHEAAHVVQQAQGVNLYGGVGVAGDTYEAHADAVADRVVAGQSAADLLGSAPAAAPSRDAFVQRKGALAEDLHSTVAGHLRASPEVTAFQANVTKLKLAKIEAQKVLIKSQAGTVSVTVAAQQWMSVVQTMLVPLHALGIALESPAPDLLDEASRDRAAIHDVLTNVARVALLLEQSQRRADRLHGKLGPIDARPLAARTNDESVAALAGQRSVLTALGGPLGWTPPTSVEAATTERYAFEACPTGADTERPDHCKVSDAERMGLRSDLHDATARALANYRHATERFKKDLDDAISRDQESQKLFVDIAGVALSAALFAGGSPAPTTKVATDIWLRVLKRITPQESLPQADTQGTLDELLEAMTMAVESIDELAISLDDESVLNATAAMKGLTRAFFEQKVGEFTATFGQQIAPLGRGVDIADAASKWIPDEGTYTAIKIPVGDRVRYAQASAQPRGGDALAAMRKRVGAPDHGTHYRFIRWIDDSLAASVPDAPLVTADKVEAMPLMTLADSGEQ